MNSSFQGEPKAVLVHEIAAQGLAGQSVKYTNQLSPGATSSVTRTGAFTQPQPGLLICLPDRSKNNNVRLNVRKTLGESSSFRRNTNKHAHTQVLCSSSNSSIGSFSCIPACAERLFVRVFVSVDFSRVEDQ